MRLYNKYILILSIAVFCIGGLFADSGTDGGVNVSGLSPIETLEASLSAPSAVLADAHTGRILFEREGRKPIPPASMTKLMTLFLCYDAIAAGEVEKDQIFIIDESGSSFSRPPFSSLMLLEEGQHVSFLDLMKGLAIASGNDAAYALAEILGPGKKAFVDKMNARARSLDLENTVFVDPDGWSGYNRVTARDYARLSKAYIDQYPEALKELHSIPFLVYPLPENMPEGREYRIQVPRKKKNTNILLGRTEGVDGLKTGYIDEAGFNFTATAIRDGVRLIAVVMGLRTDSYYQGLRQRALESELLLEYGYDHFLMETLPSPSLPEIPVWFSDTRLTKPVLSDDMVALLASGESEAVYTEMELVSEIKAPLSAGEPVGRISWYLDGTLLGSEDIIIPVEISEGAWHRIALDRLRLWWRDEASPALESLFS